MLLQLASVIQEFVQTKLSNLENYRITRNTRDPKHPVGYTAANQSPKKRKCSGLT
jgi:hypothetical protein